LGSYYDAKAYLERKIAEIEKEENDRKDKIGLVLTEEEKIEIQKDKTDFVNRAKRGEKIDLEGIEDEMKFDSKLGHSTGAFLVSFLKSFTEWYEG
jgi:hypothetical protein